MASIAPTLITAQEFRTPLKEHQELGQRVAKQKDHCQHTGTAHAASEEEEQEQQHHVDEEFVAGGRLHGDIAGSGSKTGPAVRILVDGSPRERRAIADDVAIDQIADAAKALSGWREECSGIEQYQRVEPFDMGAPEQRSNEQEDRAIDGHATLADGDDVPVLQEVALVQIRLLDHEVEPPTDTPQMLRYTCSRVMPLHLR